MKLLIISLMLLGSADLLAGNTGSGAPYAPSSPDIFSSDTFFGGNTGSGRHLGSVKGNDIFEGNTGSGGAPAAKVDLPIK